MELSEHHLFITEIFKSIQGESSYVGLPTTFVRLSGCNLRCGWCDATYSFKRGEKLSLSSIYDKIFTHRTPYVCITGGEPLLQSSIFPFMTFLADQGHHLSLETSGSLSIRKVDSRVKVILDVKCPGSRMEEKNHWENLDLLKEFDEVKFVILDRQDYEYAKSICQKFKLFEKVDNVLFSCVHHTMDSQTLVEWILEDNLPVRLNLQIHKFIWSPNTIGV